jgi:hypothetical protein
MAEYLEPTLKNVLEQTSLKWIFCGTSPYLRSELTS